MFKAVWSIGNDGFDRIEALRRAAGACPQCISDGKDAYAGSSGNAAKAKLHFELRHNGTAYNPRNYLK